ncbi:hypothetical protein EDD18DRAFT_1105299 [Armillaria luteobubalina]|uniref:WW domain-containing protein n=1 Tax=Armillaria luteobubalina TaxID=153913 RepID=A0AA39Q7Y2_9AGAR|nr:hypothetical protein EDD18DRAFT_1105299 [Armillaria luteobubalina]
MSTPPTLTKHGVWSNRLPRTHKRWSLKLWNPRNHPDVRSSEAVSSIKDVVDASGFEFTLQLSPSSSLTAIDSEDRHSPRRSITQSSSSLAAPSHDEIDTCDKDHVSVSSCSHVARSEPDVVEWEVTTVASSPNPLPASVEIGEQVISRHAISNRDDPSCNRTSTSPGVGNDNSDAASTIPHISVSGDASPRVAEPSLPTHILCDVHTLPSSSIDVVREATSQVPTECSEIVVVPQGGTPESMDNWSNDEREFIESLPSGIGHYDRKTVINEFIQPEFTVPAMQTDFNTFISPQTGEEEALPGGWRKYTHSDGKPYFYHGHDKIITEEWLYDRGIAEKVLRYYFVNHDAEFIFWLSKCTLDSYLWEFRGKMSTDFIRMIFPRSHHYFFSDLHRLTQAQWISVQKLVLLAQTDAIMSDTSTVTMSIGKLKTMRKNIVDAESKTSHFINSSIAINRALTSELDASEVAGKPASYMMALLRDQIYNYHGQQHARTYRDDSVYGYDFHKQKRTVLFRTMNFLLFHAPIKHYTELNKVWVDRMISKGRGSVSLSRLRTNGNNTSYWRPSSLRLIWRFLLYLRSTRWVLGSFLERHWQRDIGFERLSIIYSTPYALLMWRTPAWYHFWDHSSRCAWKLPTLFHSKFS